MTAATTTTATTFETTASVMGGTASAQGSTVAAMANKGPSMLDSRMEMPQSSRSVAAPSGPQWTSIHDQYQTLEILGQGTYGVVYKAEHKITKKIVGLKRCRLDTFKEFGIPETTLREVSLLRDLRHENIMTLHHVSCNTVRLYMICEYLDLDLKKYIRANNGEIPIRKVKEITFSILQGLSFCHGHRVIHRDLKPHNVLVSTDATQVKIADFGLARSSLVPGKTLTHEVITLWYRAPELLLGHCNYTTGVDMWSAGCIVAELLSGGPLYAGDSEIDTLLRICRLLGTPPKQSWPEKAVISWEAFPKLQGKPKPFASFSEMLDDDGQHFLASLLQFRSDSRLTALEALNHPWLKEVRDARMEQNNQGLPTPEYLEWQSAAPVCSLSSTVSFGGNKMATMDQKNAPHSEKSLSTPTAQRMADREKEALKSRRDSNGVPYDQNSFSDTMHTHLSQKSPLLQPSNTLSSSINQNNCATLLPSKPSTRPEVGQNSVASTSEPTGLPLMEAATTKFSAIHSYAYKPPLLSTAAAAPLLRSNQDYPATYEARLQSVAETQQSMSEHSVAVTQASQSLAALSVAGISEENCFNLADKGDQTLPHLIHTTEKEVTSQRLEERRETKRHEADYSKQLPVRPGNVHMYRVPVSFSNVPRSATQPTAGAQQPVVAHHSTVHHLSITQNLPRDSSHHPMWDTELGDSSRRETVNVVSETGACCATATTQPLHRSPAVFSSSEVKDTANLHSTLLGFHCGYQRPEASQDPVCCVKPPPPVAFPHPAHRRVSSYNALTQCVKRINCVTLHDASHPVDTPTTSPFQPVNRCLAASQNTEHYAVADGALKPEPPGSRASVASLFQVSHSHTQDSHKLTMAHQASCYDLAYPTRHYLPKPCYQTQQQNNGQNPSCSQIPPHNQWNCLGPSRPIASKSNVITHKRHDAPRSRCSIGDADDTRNETFFTQSHDLPLPVAAGSDHLNTDPTAIITESVTSVLLRDGCHHLETGSSKPFSPTVKRKTSNAALSQSLEASKNVVHARWSETYPPVVHPVSPCCGWAAYAGPRNELVEPPHPQCGLDDHSILQRCNDNVKVRSGTLKQLGQSKRFVVSNQRAYCSNASQLQDTSSLPASILNCAPNNPPLGLPFSQPPASLAATEYQTHFTSHTSLRASATETTRPSEPSLSCAFQTVIPSAMSTASYRSAQLHSSNCSNHVNSSDVTRGAVVSSHNTIPTTISETRSRQGTAALPPTHHNGSLNARQSLSTAVLPGNAAAQCSLRPSMVFHDARPPPRHHVLRESRSVYCPVTKTMTADRTAARICVSQKELSAETLDKTSCSCVGVVKHERLECSHFTNARESQITATHTLPPGCANVSSNLPTASDRRRRRSETNALHSQITASVPAPCCESGSPSTKNPVVPGKPKYHNRLFSHASSQPSESVLWDSEVPEKYHLPLKPPSYIPGRQCSSAAMRKEKLVDRATNHCQQNEQCEFSPSREPVGKCSLPASCNLRTHHRYSDYTVGHPHNVPADSDSPPCDVRCRRSIPAAPLFLTRATDSHANLPPPSQHASSLLPSRRHNTVCSAVCLD